MYVIVAWSLMRSMTRSFVGCIPSLFSRVLITFVPGPAYHDVNDILLAHAINERRRNNPDTSIAMEAILGYSPTVVHACEFPVQRLPNRIHSAVVGRICLSGTENDPSDDESSTMDWRPCWSRSDFPHIWEFVPPFIGAISSWGGIS